MTYKKTRSLIIKRIEDDKANRAKNIYCFTLSMTIDEEKKFNLALKELINSINQTIEKESNTADR